MKHKIKQIALENKISDIGFFSPKESSDSLDIFKKLVPFVTAKENERTNPSLLMPDVKTVIVLLFSYNTEHTGNISKYAHGIDYHIVLEEKSQPIVNLLNSNGYSAKFYCDDAPLNERYLAKNSGLGFIGKNGFLISPKFGSFVFLAHILTNCEITPDSPLNLSCKSCGRCIKACPTNALKTGNFYSCLSYITQKKGELSANEERLIKENDTCWGCDICQRVCPHNIDAPKTSIPEFSQNLICSLESLPETNKEFKETYKSRAFSWRGKSVLLRNLSILDKPD